MLRFVIDCLHERQYKVALAYYEPYSVNPSSSVPFYKLLSASPGLVKGYFHGCECIGVGCRLPELESSHYWSMGRWSKIVKNYDLHLMVSGSCLAALPYVKNQLPHLAWVATDWQGDREHRTQNFSLLRQAVDRFIATPIVRRLERRIITAGCLVALSEHTAAMLNQISGRKTVNRILHMPVDTQKFSPNQAKRIRYRIGFVGRFEDPRKNVRLLIESTALVAQRQPHVELVLIGDKLSKEHQYLVESLEIVNNVTVVEYLESAELADILSSFDVFVLPSYQEGLCIAALEAMSCAVPVVSTRCGGPESFILEKQNGRFCESNPASMASVILELLNSQTDRDNYGSMARETIERKFSPTIQKQVFWNLLDGYIAKTQQSNTQIYES